jgi:hypothetical protein
VRLKLDLKPIIQADKNAAIHSGKKYHDAMRSLDMDVLEIQKMILEGGMTHENALAEWKGRVGYHQSSKVETTFYRLKTILPDKLSSRLFSKQMLEAKIKCTILNKMIA